MILKLDYIYYILYFLIKILNNCLNKLFNILWHSNFILIDIYSNFTDSIR